MRENRNQPHKRHRVIVVFMLLAALAISLRLVAVQGFDSEGLKEQAIEARSFHKTLPAKRGNIVDRNGTVLATGVDRFDLWVNQRAIAEYQPKDKSLGISGPKAAAAELAPVLQMSNFELEKILTGNSRYKVIRKRVEPEVVKAIDSMNITGIAADPVQDRIYPAGAVGGNVLGFLSSDGKPLAGAELTFDKELRGTDGSYDVERGSGGQVIPTAEQVEKPAIDGATVQLTLDRDVQFRSQELIAQTVQAWGAEGGSIVVIDVKTGDIVALADYPTYDPNAPGKTPDKYRGNRSISSVFEPGSTGKLFTIAGLIDKGQASVTDELTVPYRQSFRGESIKDSHPHPTMRYTLAGVIKDSSNVGTVQLAERQDPKMRHSYLSGFGMGQKTGVELPGESAGIFHPVEDWRGRTRYTTAFGHGYAVNALQMTSAVGTFGNDGVRLEPRILKKVTRSDGSVKAKEQGREHRAVSAQTAATILQLMDNDVDDAKPGPGAVPHYAVGGKSGTAQDDDGTYTSSFIGMAPIDDPQLVVGVFVYGIQGFNSGTKVAAPVFSQIMQYALQVMRIAPTGVEGRTLRNTWGEKSDG